MIKMFRLIVALVFCAGLVSCSAPSDIDAMDNYAAVYHRNFNSDAHDVNYRILPDEYKKNITEERYIADAKIIKDKMGFFHEAKKRMLDYTQTTADGRSLVTLVLESKYSKGQAIERFHFYKDQIYRYEITSDKLVDRRL